jgi:hypothetical protein
MSLQVCGAAMKPRRWAGFGVIDIDHLFSRWANCLFLIIQRYDRFACPWTAVDTMTAIFGAASVILTAVAVIVAIGAWWRYRDIKAASVATAEQEARPAADRLI